MAFLSPRKVLYSISNTRNLYGTKQLKLKYLTTITREEIINID